MTELVVALEELKAQGETRADRHFEKLREMAVSVLPEALHEFIPKDRTGISMFFTASTKNVSIRLFAGLPDYHPMEAIFEYDREGQVWRFDRYMAIIWNFMTSTTYSVSDLTDAVIMARNIKKQETEQTLNETLAKESTVAVQ